MTPNTPHTALRAIKDTARRCIALRSSGTAYVLFIEGRLQEIWLLVYSMRIPSTFETGLIGETIAREHLEKEGLRILQTNYRSEGAEVDIVAEEGDVLVFCEVKYRRTEMYGPPELALTPRKQGRVRRAALAYLAEENIEGRICRFDVVALQQKGSRVEVRHWRNAF